MQEQNSKQHSEIPNVPPEDSMSMDDSGSKTKVDKNALAQSKKEKEDAIKGSKVIIKR